MNKPSKGVLLIVGDEPIKRNKLQIELTEAGYTTFEASDTVVALKHLGAHPVDVIIADLDFPQINGLQFLEISKSQSPKTPVILSTARGCVNSAVEAIKRGAFDYLIKPFPTELLLKKLDRLPTCQSSQTKTDGLQTEKLGPLVGRSHTTRRLFEQIRAIADNERAVLIHGEKGTGKARVAEAIHQLSRHAPRPMIKCSSQECDPQRINAELANGGTLFLEEVDALPAESQAKLLGILEQKPADIRIICATGKNLGKLVDGGTFHKDLYDHITAAQLSIPPLSERLEDLPVLAEDFLRKFAGKNDGQNTPKRISSHAMETLIGYHWPGNIHQLEEVLKQAVLSANGGEIEPHHLPLPTDGQQKTLGLDRLFEGSGGLTETIAGVERTMIDSALQKAAGNQAKAAKFLRIPRTTLRDKMAKYGMVGKNAKGETVQ